MSMIEQFVEQIIAATSYEPLDRFYLVNRVRALVGDQDAQVDADSDLTVGQQLVALAVQNQKITDDVTSREILNDQLMDLVTPTPAQVNNRFWEAYKKSPQAATKFFYQLCQDNDYIKTKAIAKNIVFEKGTQYGDLQITINLSKPEKDPKAIAAAAHQSDDQYPQCQLCMENEGYLGRLGYPARSNHRIIRMNVGGQQWGFQYSPYAYFNEHCIFLDEKHEPMQINRQTLVNLIDIERQFPEYFVGSNADLPIVGGSMLAHEHYQGGRHVFPMMKAGIRQAFTMKKYPAIAAGIVNWPMTDLRLSSSDTDQLISAGTDIMAAWKKYSAPELQINAQSNGEEHHTVTPIMHRDGDQYVLDIVLRDNNTSAEFPDGIFHPHQDVQHIKKENIGLIEVMGRAILPARLKEELAQVEQYWLGQPNQIAAMHVAWADQIKQQQVITADNVTDVLHQAVANVFARVLEDAGVFKNDDRGQQALSQFVSQF
ncbi:UDP-glucose--hexose-1-phosphate uridylyltransferase [Paucilactobacillus wasatchensis]|uniref:Galactose-1-phosphate uridylyltransferase n=1 Tax=Paucilactobacillus wasatchensis TaxID=1335616 RepID=A0A0D0YVB8_9LACO|nr:UDP-glucose--hexose-1-phosphate uridylyltransferase [Paucilactobacillus wasatchensis]KIS03229.1 Galactose-1-phosphate uridylyltransferase [Paucilactobacillus wasatchensis]